jgi:hypothetical protein
MCFARRIIKPFGFCLDIVAQEILI